MIPRIPGSSEVPQPEGATHGNAPGVLENIQLDFKVFLFIMYVIIVKITIIRMIIEIMIAINYNLCVYIYI